MRRVALALLLVLGLAGCGGGHHASVAASGLHGGRQHASGFGTPPPGDYGLATHQLTAVQLLEGYDAVTLSNVPHGPAVVGCYLSGRFPNCAQARVDFPGAKLVTIATYAAYPGAAKCVDVESGDALPSEAPAFVRHELALGVYRPCVYASAEQTGYQMWRVQDALAAAGIPRGDYTLFLADWDGNPAIPGEFDAKQWFSNCCVDRDSFLATFFAPAPKPPAPLPVCFARREATSACAAVKAKIASDVRASASSERAFVARGCPGIGQRRSWFAAHVNKPPASRHAYRQRALAASNRAWARESCAVFAQRESYFTVHAVQLQETN